MGLVSPTSALVTETLNGEYELTLIHPLDEQGKWNRLMEGCILRAPVPASATPKVSIPVYQTVTSQIYRSSKQKILHTGPGNQHAIIGCYKNGSRVVVLSQPSPLWYEVTASDGKHGYMDVTGLSLVKDASARQAAAEVVEARQLRDQPFRIYRVVPEMNQITVYARHIFYDLLDNMVKSYQPSETAAGASVLQNIGSKCLSEHSFTFYSDIETTAKDVEWEHVNPVEAILGDEGFTARYGGELVRDWYDVFVVSRVGSDTNVEIRQGKNLLGVSYDVDQTNVTTRILPTGQDKDGKPLYLPEIYVDSPYINEYTHPKWMHLEVSGAKEVTSGDNRKTKAQCLREMREAARQEFTRGCDLPSVTLKVDFINCADTEEYREYKPLQNIFLGDAVRVIAPRIGVAVSMRMTQYTYDCLQRKYTEMTLGTVEKTLENNMITSRQIPSGAISGAKLAAGSVDSMNLKADAIAANHIQSQAITTDKLAAGAVNAEQLAAQSVTAEKIAVSAVTAEKLAAGCVDAQALSAITAKIGSLTAQDISTDTLAAALAAFTVVTAGSVEFDRATVTHLVSEALNLSFGVGDEVLIHNLKVAYAQMVSASIGNLCIRSSEGGYYTLDVDSSGNVTATPATLADEETAEGQTSGGRVILETDILADNLGTTNLLSTYALINRIDAARIDVDSLFAREAFITRLRTSEIVAGKSLTIIAGDAEEAKTAASQAVANVQILYASGESATAPPASGWSATAPDRTEGRYVWQKTVTTYNNGTTSTSTATNISGADGEPATTLRIESSRGTVFKNNLVSTVLSAVIYRGSERITDALALRRVFGNGAYLQWSWQRMDENRFGVISASDTRISNNGFSFTLSPEDVDTKVTFMCELIVE